MFLMQNWPTPTPFRHHDVAQLLPPSGARIIAQFSLKINTNFLYENTEISFQFSFIRVIHPFTGSR